MAKSGRERDPGGAVDEGARLGDHQAPVGARRLGAEPEEAQGRAEQDGIGDAQARLDDQRRPGVGQDLAEQDVGRALGPRPRRLDEILVGERKRDAAGDAARSAGCRRSRRRRAVFHNAGGVTARTRRPSMIGGIAISTSAPRISASSIQPRK